jgi:hypothetical protein
MEEKVPEVKALVREMGKLKCEFDRKWEILVGYIKEE